MSKQLCSYFVLEDERKACFAFDSCPANALHNHIDAMPSEYRSESANTEDLQFSTRDIYSSVTSTLNTTQRMDHWSSPKGELTILLTGLVYANVRFI